VNTQFAVAVHVLTLLSTVRERVSAETLSLSVGANPVHVRRVLGQLAKAGLVASRPGPHGGWLTTQDPPPVTLGTVFGAVNGDARVVGIHDAAPECTVGQRIQAELGSIEREAAAALVADLDRTTVADLIHETDVDADWRPAAA
jgi:Rrf2 family protein